MAAKLGKTAKHYKSNSKSRAKHVKDNSPGGKYAHSNEYKRQHAEARKRLNIKSSNIDASRKSNGSFRAESRKINRGRGGARRR